MNRWIRKTPGSSYLSALEIDLSCTKRYANARLRYFPLYGHKGKQREIAVSCFISELLERLPAGQTASIAFTQRLTLAL